VFGEDIQKLSLKMLHLQGTNFYLDTCYWHKHVH